METTLDERWNGNTAERRFGTETWPRELKGPSEIPEGFRPHFPKYRGDFPHTVLIPEDRGILFRSHPPRLLTVDTDIITILESEGNRGVRRTDIPVREISVMVLTRNLLRSGLSFRTGRAAAGIQYNTVMGNLFEHAVSIVRTSFRERSAAPDTATLETERGKFRRLMDSDYKYMNYGAGRVLPGDTVGCIAYQSEAVYRTLKVFGLPLVSWKLTSHIAFLTDHELCLIQEEHQLRSPGMPSYGSAFYFIPLDRIDRINSESAKKPGFTRISVRMKAGNGVTAIIEDGNPEFEKLLALLSERGITVLPPSSGGT